MIQSEQQFQQLMMQYEQLKNGAYDIANMIKKEDFDSAITMLKNRDQLFLSCKIIRRYLELTPEQKEKADKIFNEIRDLEKGNIDTLTKKMEETQAELVRTQKLQKLHKVYSGNYAEEQGTIVNINN